MRMHGTKRPDGTAMPYVTTASENAAKAYAMSAADASASVLRARLVGMAGGERVRCARGRARGGR